MHFYCFERKQVDDEHGIINWLTDWLAGRLPGWHKTYHYSCPAGVTQSSVHERHTLQVSHFLDVVTHGTQLHDESGHKGIIL